MTVQKEKVTRRVVCRKCKSDQIVGNKRGYNFKRMFLILFLMLATLIAGLTSISVDDIIPISSLLRGIAIFIAGFIMLLGAPITLFSGFIGRKNIVNGCMNCGNTWMPKK
ncbi:hypothetical protein ICM_05035 [Bacillus cereus BAG1X2-3]|uniref:Uncharacterized protein n=2 Tax=Bacillus cereus group TaxID=86661 RepID=A0A9X7AJK7_BACTU|nr:MULTISPECIES: hypothetical protein [Bacillus cereus group]EOO24683.1 hypothetical protein ICC_05182 [Bacillus cereus BAG1X1-1]EOO43093.1 hypothetical protein ICI_06032 [Bacillus cereus BAG1X2-1]EOO45094.1 hypothetical protein ICK_05857 [Bacillus cereus BAG1X2-2]EOO62127.1 hypothetical protein ICM_05035 [Bacillus cereus BAG1X2-3]EOP01302.1 hypothetical protein ICO_05580 [Bacillus cereus BAG2O-1]